MKTASALAIFESIATGKPTSRGRKRDRVSSTGADNRVARLSRTIQSPVGETRSAPYPIIKGAPSFPASSVTESRGVPPLVIVINTRSCKTYTDSCAHWREIDSRSSSCSAVGKRNGPESVSRVSKNAY
jgi:hypothetical protein